MERYSVSVVLDVETDVDPDRVGQHVLSLAEELLRPSMVRLHDPRLRLRVVGTEIEKLEKEG